METPAGMDPFEISALISLAGPAAERRAQARDPEGWRLLLAKEAVVAHHEAGHVVIALVLGWTASMATIRPDPSIRVGRRASLGAAGLARTAPPPLSFAPPCDLDRLPEETIHTDMWWVARCAFVLTHDRSWRDTLRLARDLRRRARHLVDQYWPAIHTVANGLISQGSLDEAAILGLMREAVAAQYIRRAIR